MRLRCGILLFFLLPCFVFGQDITVPSQIKAKVGRPVRFEVKVPAGKKLGTEVGWVEDENTPAEIDRLYFHDPNIAKFRVNVFTPGRYVVIFWVEGSIDAKRVVIDAGTPVPPPPPVPPVPPTPPVDDILLRQMKDAFVKDGSKVSTFQAFTGMCDSMAKTGYQSKAVNTLFQLNGVFKTARKAVIQEELPNVRAVLDKEMAKEFGDANGEISVDLYLSDEVRKKVSDVFTRVTAAMKGTQP